MKPLRLSRRTAIATCLAAMLSTHTLAQEVTLRVGDQRGNLRAVLEAADGLKGAPYKIVWTEFPNAAPLLEALRADAIDGGTVGDAPLTFAAAAGLQAKAIAATSYEGNGIIVLDKSPFRSLRDLVGKRIAAVKGSAGHNLLLQSLAEQGIAANAVELAFIAPSEATLALTQESVDAVASWEPYIAFATLRSGARILLDGKQYPATAYFVASDTAIARKQAALKDFVERSHKARRWALSNVDGYSRTIAKLVGIPEDVARLKQDREHLAPKPIDDKARAIQQGTIDRYAANGLIPKAFDAASLLDARFNP